MFELMTMALLLVWCTLTLQTLVNLLLFRRLERARQAPSSRVSIVVPARNEERYVGTTLDAALGQEYPDFEVIVVDDGSTDKTADEIARRTTDVRLVPLKARPLEPGWLGKPNALATGAAQATGEWILFMDADVKLHPKALVDSVAACERHEWDHLALFPYFEREGFWEQMLMPVIPVVALVYLPSFLAFFRKARFAAGGGAFGLVRRRAYQAIGGHERLKSSVVDDVRLAMELKQAGFTSSARVGTHRLRLRMYHGLSEIVEGFTKNAHAGFGSSNLRLALLVAGSLWIAVTPFLWPFVPGSLALGASLVLLLFCRALVQLRLGFPMWPIFLSPVTTLTALFIVFRSLRMARHEGVVRWRGREYPYGSTEF